MRLGIDLDGVVANFNGGWIAIYNNEFGTNISLDAVDSWGAAPKLTHFAHMGSSGVGLRTSGSKSVLASRDVS